jgi:hypothetical protein
MILWLSLDVVASSFFGMVLCLSGLANVRRAATRAFAVALALAVTVRLQ